MTDVTYIDGTTEYLIFEVEDSAPGATFTASEWGVKVALCDAGTAFNAGTATWIDGALELVGTTNYAKVLLGSTLDPVAGKYKAFLKLTKTVGGTEIPVIPARGFVRVIAG